MAERRADAQRNRTAVLQAAQEAVERDGAAALRVGAVAAAAGVGPGTVYRAFGSKRGLLLALVDERERRLQERVLRGRPPLGPGAPAAERLVAFVDALHRLTAEQREVLVAADEGAPTSRYLTGAHAAWRQHVAVLLAELHPDADAGVLAELVLAPLTAALHVHLLDERAVPAARVRAELLRLARLVAAPGP
ncbi:MAG: TetR family transcriptional regulator [Solirubrobacterales bacterium]|nr:TetR family transcriptional regulator [Solirubrobacterales bacterium]